MEPNRHPSPDSFERFAGMPLSERRMVLRHVRACRRCSVEAARIWRLAGSLSPARRSGQVDFSSVLARVSEVETALAWERQQAPELLKELEAHPQPRRQTIVRNSRRFWRWGLAEYLLSVTSDAIFDDPGRALDLAELALDVTQRLVGSSYGPTLVADFQARAWKAVGNTRRVVSDLRGAEEAFEQARVLLAAGTGDPLEQAQLDYYLGALRNAQRRFSEAVAHLDRAFGAYSRLGDTHEAARALICKAIAVSKSNPHESIRLQRSAIPLIDEEREPRLLLAAKHNFAVDLIDTGHAAEAMKIVQELRPAYQRLGAKMLILRLRWVEGQAAQALGQSALAEEIYLEVIAAYQSHEIPYELAVATMDLATLYAEQGRNAEIKQLALRMLPIFQALEIERETIAALMLFRQAAESEAASLALIQHVAAFVKRAQNDPAARFAPPN